MPHFTRMLTMSRRSTFRLGSAGLVAALAPASARAAQSNEAATLAANKALVRRLFDRALNLDDESLIETVYAPDAILRNASTRQAPGPAGMPISLQAFRAEFPDVSATVDIAIAEGDIVATHVVWYGTHPPQGTHVVGRSMHLFRITGAHIAEEWCVGWEWIAKTNPRNNLPAGNPLLQP
jgi:predicted SnoaL-like aldol condensation-catalyzing enzyme